MSVLAAIEDGYDEAVAVALPPRERIGTRSQWIAKRLADRGLAALLLVMLLPALAILIVLIMASDFGSPFYAHERVGRGGRKFRCLKLRSMRKDSAQRLVELLATDENAAREWETNRKLRNDPRIIRGGGFIRSTSLDELPQLFNILKGEMSFVGPRPVTADELGRYGAGAVHYLAVPPGLTGLWQVSGRSDIGYDERVALDVAYVERWSLPRDFSILMRTPRAVFAMAGAC